MPSTVSIAEPGTTSVRTGSRRAASLLATFVLIFVACTDEAPPPSQPGSSDAGAQEVRVLALGDFGTGGEDQDDVAQAMCRHLTSEAFGHVVTTGDNVYPEGDPAHFQDKFVRPYDCLFHGGVRFHATLGNHDILTRGGRPEIRHEAFGMPARYYAWNLGPVSFVMIDSNDVDRTQLGWIDRRLNRMRDDPWIVVVFHHPLYATGSRHIDTPGFQELFEQRFANAGVDLVLNGHEHLYSRAETAGVTYIVTGGGGARLDECGRPLPQPIIKCVSTLHFLELEATSEMLRVDVMTSRGELLESVRLDANV